MTRRSASVFFRSLIILSVIGFFLLLYIVLKFGLNPKLKLDSASICQKYGSAQVPYNADALADFRVVADYCIEAGEREEATQILARVYKGQSEIFGPRNVLTLETLEILAAQFVFLEKYDEGLSLYWRVYKIREKILGPTHSDTLHALQMLAHVYHFKGKYEKAVGFLKVIYKQRKLLLGPEHTDTMEIRLLMASSLENADHSLETREKVLKYYGQVYKVYSRAWGENDRTLSVLSAIGKCLVNLRRFDEAIPIFKSIMKTTEKMPQSELYEEAENLLGLSLVHLGRTEEARLVHVKARRNRNKRGKGIQEYASNIRVHGRLTPEVDDQVNSVLNLAKVAMVEQNFEKALKNLEEVYAVIEKDHPRTQGILQEIIGVHGALRNVEKAFEMSIELFHVVRQHSHSEYNKNEKIAQTWQTVFSAFMKLSQEHAEDEMEQLFSPKCKEISETVLKTVELTEIDEEQPNPTILKTLAMAGHLCGKLEIAMPAASKLIPILQRERDAEPKPSEEEIEYINADINAFQKLLDDNQSCGRGKKIEIQNHEYRDEL